MQALNIYKKVWICLFLCVSNICFASQAEFDAYIEQAITTFNDDYKREQLYKEAIKVADKDKNMLNMGFAITSLARLFQYQKDYELSENMYKRALEINQKYLGEKHDNTIQAVYNLADIYTIRAKDVLAENLYKRGLEINERYFGIRSINTSKALCKLASFYEILKKYDLSESLYKKALQIQEELYISDKSLWADMSSTLEGLASTYIKQERYNLAEKLYKQVLDIEKTVLNRHTKITLKRLARLYEKQGKYTLAEDFHKQASQAKSSGIFDAIANEVLDFENK